MEKALDINPRASTAKVLEDKLHAIAVQLGKLNEFMAWLRMVLEAEIKKDAEKKGGAT